MNSVDYLDDLRKASSDAATAALLASAAAPFDRAEWWEGLARHCGMTPLFMRVRDGTGMALAALQAQGGVVTPLANWYTFRWRPLLSAGADRQALFAALARDLARQNWRVTLPQLPDEDGTASALAAAFRAAGWRVRCDAHDSNHVLPLNGRSHAEYLASRPGQLRTTLKRRSGKVTCQIHTAFRDDIWAAYQAIYAASWKPQEGSPPFLEAFARAESAAGRLRMGLAEIDGRPVAAQFWTVEAGTAFIHKLAHREDARTLSPGSVLSAALFQHVIDIDGVALVDFGTGDDPYKRDWMDDIRLRYRMDALRPAHPRAWPIIAREMLRGLHRPCSALPPAQSAARGAPTTTSRPDQP